MKTKVNINWIINKAIVLLFLLTASTLNLNAQVEEYTDIKSAVEEQFKKSIAELKGSMIKSDPYGIWLSVSISETKEGETKGKLYENTDVFENVQVLSKTFISKQKFYKYNFDIAPKEVVEPGRYIYAVGIFAELVTNNPAEYAVTSNSYTYKTNIDGVFYQYVIHTSAVALIKKPANGSIVTDVYFYDKDGYALLWDQSWGAVMPKIAYTRIGPGSKSSNTKKGSNVFRSPDIGGVLTIAEVYNPGYYLPVVKFRGCTQEFTPYDRFTEYESVLRLEKSKVHWNYIKTFDDGTVVPESGLKTETIRAGDLKTYYSKGNIVKGEVLDSDGNTVEKSVQVVLSPKYSPASFTDQKVSSKPDGTYEFEDVESGVYSIYVEGNKKKAKRLEICNCPQKYETQNFTYKINVNYSPLYSITAEYTNSELLKVKYKWDNVSVGFPEDLSVLPPEPEHIGDIDMYDLKPPFTANLGAYGKFGFYSNIPERNEDGYVVSEKILNENFTDCNIDQGSFVIKKVAIESPHIFVFLEFNVELLTEDPSVFLLFPIAVGCLNDDGPYAFKWNKLDESIIMKLENGESAVKTLTNKGGASMTIRFEPQE